MAVSQEPLSVRNNNPGNLRYVGQEGASPGEGGFAKFETPQAGVDAMRRQIELDTQTRGMNLTQFINKYAPPSENKTQNYIDFVVQKVGLDPSQPVPREKIPALQAAMVEMEGGSRAVAAFNLASAPQTTPARPTAQATRTTKPVQVAAAAAPAAKLTLTDLPPGYRAALAANYIADTEDPSQSIAEKAMAMMEELQGGGGGPKGVATFNKAMGSEAGVDPFALMAKAQEGQEQAPQMRRRPVPRMPIRFAEGGEANANDIDTQLQELYRQSLGREADTGGFEYWKKEFGPEIDTAERLRFIEGAAPEVQQRLAAGDKNLPAYMQVNPEVRRALASQDLTTEQYRTLANYFGNQWIGGEAEDPASLTRRDYIERPRSGYDFATFLATRSQQHGAQADTQNRMANLLAPYLGNVGQATGVGGESFDQYIVNPMTGQTEIAKPLGVDNMYRIYRGPHQGTIGDPEKGSRYAVGMDYKVDPVTGQATFVGPYTEYYKDLGHNDWQGPLGILSTAAGLYYFPGMDLGSMLTRGAITLGTEGAKRMFKDGGEVDKEDTELSNEERKEQIDRQMRIAEQGMSYSAGPLGIRAIKKPGGYEARVSSQIDRLTPYLDFDPLTGTFRPTEVGASYGNMRPEGGYEIRYSHPLTAQGVPQLSGQYRQQLGRNAELQASGYYSPIPNARDAYGANVRYIQRFEKGGDVSNPADIAEQMTVGTVPEGKPGAAAQVAKDVVRGAQYLPYDLLGAPVDIATMAMRPFGYKVEKPFLGSEYLIDKAAQAGIADRPTGSLAETTSRIGMGFVNPAAVARQIPKGIAAVERGAETLGTGAVRAITGKQDITPEQIYQAVGDTRGILSLGAPAIVKPKGGTFISGENSNFDTALNAMSDSLEGRRQAYRYVQGGEEDIKKINEVDNFFKSKFKNYYQKKLGSQNDPLREAFIRGDFNGADWFNAEEIARLREIATDPNTVGSVSRKQALDELNRKYDAWTDISAIFPDVNTLDEVNSFNMRTKSGQLETSPLGLYSERVLDKLKEQGANVRSNELAYSVDTRPASEFDARAVNALKEKDLVYDVASTPTLQDRMVSIRDYLMTLNPNQIKNITFEDAIIGTERYHEALKNPAAKFTPEQLFEGREKLFQPSEKYQWSEIKTEDALRREGEAMNHCIGGDEYCRQLTTGIGKHFSLQDAQTGVPHTTISIYRSPFAPPNAKHVVVEQIKGNSNSAPTKYFNEVEKFLEDYEKRVGKIYITEDKRHIPPAFKGPEYTELPRGYEGNQYAKGGMVDKPLYDRAA